MIVPSPVFLLAASVFCLSGSFRTMSMVAGRFVKKTSGNGGRAVLSEKRLCIIRHGQATHNPRAEKARKEGCTYDTFMELMRQDDALDAPLTKLGNMQANEVANKLKKTETLSSLLAKNNKKETDLLVVSSPLSRAIETANLAISPSTATNRICVEHFREINGLLLNAQRRNRMELERLFPSWDFQELHTNKDELWTPSLETRADCSERGYQGLKWIMERPEQHVVLVSHGGLLKFVMTQHPNVALVDGRTEKTGEEREVDARFSNCEARYYKMSWEDDSDSREAGRKPNIQLMEMDNY